MYAFLPYREEVWRGMILVAALFIMPGCANLVFKSADVNIVQQNSIGYFLPKGLIHLQLTKDADQYYKLTIDPKLVPDEDALYTFRYVPASWADDTINISVGQNGLLQSVTTTNHDKSVEISKKVIQIATKVVKATQVFVPKGLVKERIRLKEFLNVVFDPDEKDEIKRIKDNLKEVGIYFDIKPLFTGKKYVAVDAQRPTSINYRPLLPYVITIRSLPSASASPSPSADAQAPPLPDKSLKAKKAGTVPLAPTPGSTSPDEEPGFERTEIIYLPSTKGPTLSLDITRAPFVTKVTTLTFQEGILVNCQITKPSEIEAGLDIPLNFVEALVALPAELIQLKIDTTKKETMLTTEQKTAIDAQMQLIKAQQQLIQILGKDNKPGTTDAPQLPVK